MAEWWQRAHTSWSSVSSYVSNFAILENIVLNFLEPLKARKLKIRVNMDNDGMLCVYRNRGHRSITL